MRLPSPQKSSERWFGRVPPHHGLAQKVGRRKQPGGGEGGGELVSFYRYNSVKIKELKKGKAAEILVRIKPGLGKRIYEFYSLELGHILNVLCKYLMTTGGSICVCQQGIK